MFGVDNITKMVGVWVNDDTWLNSGALKRHFGAMLPTVIAEILTASSLSRAWHSGSLYHQNIIT